MRKYALVLFLVLLCCLSACKKDARPQIPAALVGKWYLRQYKITASSNTFTDTPYTVRYSDTATNVYYQFNNDGTGLEKAPIDPNFVIIPPAGFTYRVSGNNITFSRITTVMMSTACTFEMPTSNTLIIRDNYSYTSAGIVVNNLQEITLSK
ncbi:MAG TPA: lipocalin family protein [Mucilaginibacter sp.]|jgi:hypothetical protein|nr:lipocalin family protein [Mucilaginibacter sp.]